MDLTEAAMVSGLDRLRVVAALLIILAWMASLAWEATHPGFKVDADLRVGLVFIGGWLFGPWVLQLTRKNGNHER